MSHYSIYLPLRTQSEGNLRGREHWTARAKRAKKQREAVLLVCKAQGIPQLSYYDLWTATITLTRLAPRFLDEGDNLNSSMKSIRDALADDKRPSVLGIDDRDSRIKWEYRQQKAKEYGVNIEIEVTPVRLEKGRAKTEV